MSETTWEIQICLITRKREGREREREREGERREGKNCDLSRSGNNPDEGPKFGEIIQLALSY